MTIEVEEGLAGRKSCITIDSETASQLHDTAEELRMSCAEVVAAIVRRELCGMKELR